jgi:hypothetical protein
VADIFTKYLYLWGSIAGCILFILVYLKRKDLRSRMLSAGVIVGLIGILSESVFFQDYWTPPLLFRFGIFGGIEDFLFGIVAGGVGVVIYDVVFHKRLRRSYHPQIWIMPIVLISQVLSVIIFFKGLGFNSIYASSVGFLVPAILIIYWRRDLAVEVLLSAVLSGLVLVSIEFLMLIFAPAYLENYFLLHKKTLLIFGVIPLTELIWGVSFGALAGPLYDFSKGTRPIAIRR